jgi:hypothetical protein
MTSTSNSDNRVLLTADHVREWQRQERLLSERIQKDQQQLADVRRKLEAVALLSPDFGLGEPSFLPQATIIPPENSQNEERGALTEAVPRILRACGKPLRPVQMRDALTKEGFRKDQLGNYFYTVLLRLSRRGDIVKVGKRYRAPDRDESEAADDQNDEPVSPAASIEHRLANGGTPSEAVNPQPGGGG